MKLDSLIAEICQNEGVTDEEAFRKDVLHGVQTGKIFMRLEKPTAAETREAALQLCDLVDGLLFWIWRYARYSETGTSPEGSTSRLLKSVLASENIHPWDHLEQIEKALRKLKPLRSRLPELLPPKRQPRLFPASFAICVIEILKRHGVTPTGYEKGPAALLLCAMSAEAGDRSITPEAARKLLARFIPAKRKPKTARIRPYKKR